MASSSRRTRRRLSLEKKQEQAFALRFRWKKQEQAFALRFRWKKQEQPFALRFRWKKNKNRHLLCDFAEKKQEQAFALQFRWKKTRTAICFAMCCMRKPSPLDSKTRTAIWSAI
jgi:hypothetical protein